MKENPAKHVLPCSALLEFVVHSEGASRWILTGSVLSSASLPLLSSQTVVRNVINCSSSCSKQDDFTIDDNEMLTTTARASMANAH
jgi:hypothetical protein